MRTSKFLAILGICSMFSVHAAFAEDVDIDENVVETEEVLILEAEDDDSLIDVIVEEGTPESAPTATVIVVDKSVAERRATAVADTTGGRGTTRGAASVTAAHDAARIALMGAPKAPPQIRVPTVGAVATSGPKAENIECSPGEYPKNGKCERCEQKNNPGVDWADSGKNCKIKECISDEYFLYGEKTEQPKCLKKCEIWGGSASRQWMTEDWDVCGSGAGIDCDTGFVKTREKTSSSEVEYWHCIPKGIMSGSCSKDTIRNCNFPNGRAQQTCENGFWSNCSLNRFCEAGFREDNHRQVWTVVRKKDTQTGAFDCVKK
ncbi:MAG: hypothetical protein FWG18_01315 [Alphaproteobacteria bacterium]|nr:hypothetical protein [Alphaproteobacteria bacterium]